MNEIWINTNNASKKLRTVISFSNLGKIKLRDNTIIIPTTYYQLQCKNKHTYLHRLIAENFIQKTEEDLKLNRNWIDHIEKHPANYAYNDVRNLRWCTRAENMNFEECRRNLSAAGLNRVVSNNTKLKMSKVNIGRHWYNNGIINVHVYECPPGFKPGRLKDKKKEDQNF